MIKERELDERKTKQLLAYIASKTDIGKTKLMKLLYLIDFTAYERTGKSITNDEYKHWTLGPVPTKIWRGINDDLVNGVLDKTEQARGTGNYIKFTPTRKPDTDVFSPTELTIINEIIENFGDKFQEELVTMLHRELPYRITKEDETIPYFLACYRDFKKLPASRIKRIQKDKAFMSRIRNAFRECKKSIHVVPDAA